jgi:hypothetical protein
LERKLQRRWARMPASATTKTALGVRAGEGFDLLRNGDDLPVVAADEPGSLG